MKQVVHVCFIGRGCSESRSEDCRFMWGKPVFLSGSFTRIQVGDKYIEGRLHCNLQANTHCQSNAPKCTKTRKLARVLLSPPASLPIPWLGISPPRFVHFIHGDLIIDCCRLTIKPKSRPETWLRCKLLFFFLSLLSYVLWCFANVSIAWFFWCTFFLPWDFPSHRSLKPLLNDVNLLS